MLKNVNPRLTADEERRLRMAQVDAWNRVNPVGSPIWYWYSSGYGPVYETAVRLPAKVDEHGEMVAFLDHIPKPVSLHQARPVREHRRNELNPIPLGEQPPAMVAQADRGIMTASNCVKLWKNIALPGFGDKNYLLQAASLLRESADCLEAAFRELEQREDS